MFYFSSRRRHTRYIGDWSSDVCSSDLERRTRADIVTHYDIGVIDRDRTRTDVDDLVVVKRGRQFLKAVFPQAKMFFPVCERSEERRVGKECRYGGAM